MIAHYGLSRLPYVLAGKKVEAGIACLLAIDEPYRKTPVFLEVTVRLLKLFRSTGWVFVTGLANRSGLLEFHKAFGFKDIGQRLPIFANLFIYVKSRKRCYRRSCVLSFRHVCGLRSGLGYLCSGGRQIRHLATCHCGANPEI